MDYRYQLQPYCEPGNHKWLTMDLTTTPTGPKEGQSCMCGLTTWQLLAEGGIARMNNSALHQLKADQLAFDTTQKQGTKHDTGKIRLELLSVPALNAIAEVMTFGAKKYADHNWRKGFDWSRLYGAALRHLTAHMSGEDKDPESGLSHLAHLGCCVMFLLEHESRNLGTDDRFRTTGETSK